MTAAVESYDKERQIPVAGSALRKLLERRVFGRSRMTSGDELTLFNPDTGDEEYLVDEFNEVPKPGR